MNNELQKILDKFDYILKNYELDKKIGQMSVDSICHLFPNEMIAIKDYITNLQEKYDKALELLVDFNMPCGIDNFNLLDTDYCELNCSVDDEQYKKCWNKFIEWRLQGVDKE